MSDEEVTPEPSPSQVMELENIAALEELQRMGAGINPMVAVDHRLAVLIGFLLPEGSLIREVFECEWQERLGNIVRNAKDAFLRDKLMAGTDSAPLDLRVIDGSS